MNKFFSWFLLVVPLILAACGEHRPTDKEILDYVKAKPEILTFWSSTIVQKDSFQNITIIARGKPVRHAEMLIDNKPLTFWPVKFQFKCTELSFWDNTPPKETTKEAELNFHYDEYGKLRH